MFGAGSPAWVMETSAIATVRLTRYRLLVRIMAGHSDMWDGDTLLVSILRSWNVNGPAYASQNKRHPRLHLARRTKRTAAGGVTELDSFTSGGSPLGDIRRSLLREPSRFARRKFHLGRGDVCDCGSVNDE